MSRKQPNLDRLREGRSELENHYIDELVGGHISRREFVRRGSILGMSAPLLAAILSGEAPAAAAAKAIARPAAGGTLRVASTAPAAAVNPLTVADSGGLCMLNQTGEFLAFDSNLKLMLQPMLATKWSANKNGTVWTFTLRSGVKFSNGQPMTADDVVYTFQQLADPKNASNALSTFTGVLTPAGVKKINATTVEFTLEASNGNFPYLVSSDNYNAIIVPSGTDYSDWQKTFIGTGAFKLSSYTQGVGAEFVPNPYYWGSKPALASTSFKFYSSQAPMILALEGNDVDVVTQFVPTGATALLNNSSYNIIRLKSSNHRELSMRNDLSPFKDARVRQAVAYTLDRSAMVSALLDGYGSAANDYPFAPSFPSSVPMAQRKQDYKQAKALLSAAGYPKGFSTTLKTEIYEEIPELAQVIKAQAAKAGIDITLDIETQDAYYGKATFGNSDWLDGAMSLVDYGSRGVPNVFLEAPLTSKGPWNGARFHNATYDSLVKQYVASVDLSTQRAIAAKIEKLLLAETPIIYPYWIDGLTASTKNVKGLNPTSISQLYLNNASIS